MLSQRISALILALSVGYALDVAAQDGHDHHEEEGAAHQEEQSEHMSGEGLHDHGDVTIDGESGQDEGHGEHEQVVLELTSDAAQMAGIRVAHVARGGIGTAIHVPGEVGFNEDRLVHVVPRFAGLAKKVYFRVGDRVRAVDVVATVESNESLREYSITAPISGWVVEKHVTPGEFVSEENPIYMIADLSHVWVNLAIYSKDAERVEPGQRVTLHATGSDLWTEGTIEYLTPVLDARTRSLTARIVIPNPDNSWRPGTFVHADIVAGHDGDLLLVEKDAVQVLNEEHVVFVPLSDVRFVATPVVIGKSDARYVEILGGLDEGTEYVAAGAFELKAEIVTSALGGHAGHGH